MQTKLCVTILFDGIWYLHSSDESYFLRRGGMKSPALDEKVVWRKSVEENKERRFLTEPAINEELVGIAEDEN